MNTSIFRLSQKTVAVLIVAALMLAAVLPVLAGGFVDNKSSRTVYVKWGVNNAYDAQIGANQNSDQVLANDDANSWAYFGGDWYVYLGFNGPYTKGSGSYISLYDWGYVTCYNMGYQPYPGHLGKYCDRNY